MIDYEIKDIEIQLFGQTAVAYYVAEWKNHLRELDQVATLTARAADIYAKKEGRWI